nr:hypothetical protein [Eubacterium sp.]
MLREIKNKMTVTDYESMRKTVVKMNENVETFIYQEMLNHKADYDIQTGLRKTSYVPENGEIQYGCIPITGADNHQMGLASCKTLLFSLFPVGNLFRFQNLIIRYWE